MIIQICKLEAMNEKLKHSIHEYNFMTSIEATSVLIILIADPGEF